MSRDDWNRANQRAIYGQMDPEAFARQCESEVRADRAADLWLEQQKQKAAEKPKKKKKHKRK